MTTTLFALTDDGWRIALHRHRGDGKRCHPVVCCHGLAANRVGFDVTPEHSLAHHLAARGYDVFVVELRGHGDSGGSDRICIAPALIDSVIFARTDLMMR
jgi:alpha-beta hydrolase superfamily lysophospholipase